MNIDTLLRYIQRLMYIIEASMAVMCEGYSLIDWNEYWCQLQEKIQEKKSRQNYRKADKKSSMYNIICVSVDSSISMLLFCVYINISLPLYTAHTWDFIYKYWRGWTSTTHIHTACINNQNNDNSSSGVSKHNIYD